MSFQDVDAMTVVMLFLAAALAGLLFGAGSAWRGLQRDMREAPIRLALRRHGGARAEREVRYAEIRCALCSSRRACEGRLRRGEPLPPECPNRSLFFSRAV